MVEETILLSKQIEHNGHLSGPKVIGLKKIPLKQAEQEVIPEVNPEEKKIAMEIEIANLNQKLQNLNKQSDQILFDLKEKIEQEKEAWNIQKEQERKEAQQQGYEDGFQQGKQEVLEQYQTLIQEANDIVDKAKEDYYKTIEKHEKAIITLAIKAAEKILTKEIEQDESYVTSIIRKAMEELKDHSHVAIYVSPKDYELVINQKDELEQSLQEGEILSIYVDQKLSQGDCILSHPFGQIDISIDLQLQQIKNALEEKLTENQ